NAGADRGLYRRSQQLHGARKGDSRRELPHHVVRDSSSARGGAPERRFCRATSLATSRKCPRRVSVYRGGVPLQTRGRGPHPHVCGGRTARAHTSPVSPARQGTTGGASVHGV